MTGEVAMANGEEQMSCSSRCWIAAAVVGLFVALFALGGAYERITPWKDQHPTL